MLTETFQYNDKLKSQFELLYQMKRIRYVEEEIARRYKEGNMRCPTHLSIGQEAVAVAVGKALRRDDLVISTHRSHAHYLGKGGNLKKMIAELYGKVTGCSRGRGGSMHLIDLSVGFEGSTAIVANSIPVGVGMALASVLKSTNQVCCIFFGDGAVEEGVFYESLNFSIIKRLPVLFVCENNLYSVYSPLNVRQPQNRKIHEMVGAIGLRAREGDGNNVEQIYSTVVDTLQSIRQGDGPQFLEFNTYRWREHCGPNYDNNIGYRTEEEFLLWKERDPILLYENRLLGNKELTFSQIDAMHKSIATEIDAAFTFAEDSPYPDPLEAFDNVYKQ
jgi:pyruvate dehydrogenase E1 component alpha subunit